MIKLSFTQFKKYLSRSIHPAFPLVVMILLCFVILQIIITYFPVTMPFLGHSYILLIALSTFWFGLEGGFLTATLASALHFANLRITHREILDAAILNSLYTIFLIYYLCGTILGYISGKQNRLKDEFKKLAQYDELTGCLNFRWTMRILEQELAACKRYNKILAIALLDIDFFKRINDTFGHIVGNEILKNFAEHIKNNLRRVDVVGRYGGEEFLIIFPETTPETVVAVLERIKETLNNLKIKSPYLEDVAEYSIKFSAGIASYPKNGADTRTLLGLVDYALLEAKNSGRNRCVIEKRRALRFKPSAELKITLQDSNFAENITPVEIIDISRTGMQLLLSKNINNLEVVDCRILFPGKKTPMKINCSIVHVFKTTDGLFRTGLYFINPRAGFQSNIEAAMHNPIGPDQHR